MSKKFGFNIFIFVFNLITILCLISQIIFKHFNNIMPCILTLILFILPFLIQWKYKINFPRILLVCFYLFLFCAGILGEVYSFYIYFKYWDIILHAISGFLCASIGLSIINLLYPNFINMLKPLFLAIFIFCFSMTIGVFFEFVEYGLDKLFNSDHQKDTYISVLSSNSLDESLNNKPNVIKGVNKTILYDKDNKELGIINGGYLDIGLGDTMSDLLANFIGAFVYSGLSYICIKKQNKNSLVCNFILKKNN